MEKSYSLRAMLREIYGMLEGDALRVLLQRILKILRDEEETMQ